ncbi:hypothetical protein M5K25_019294 [Dendrobium thyrsiflorum]|uniref:Uncharacterized protein n=1 Tax=Dendrobium thyrsiflorum TaxID=117978 RepID=A0ABD0UE94_DENTH
MPDQYEIEREADLAWKGERGGAAINRSIDHLQTSSRLDRIGLSHGRFLHAEGAEQRRAGGSRKVAGSLKVKSGAKGVIQILYLRTMEVRGVAGVASHGFGVPPCSS